MSVSEVERDSQNKPPRAFNMGGSSSVKYRPKKRLSIDGAAHGGSICPQRLNAAAHIPSCKIFLFERCSVLLPLVAWSSSCSCAALSGRSSLG